MKLRVLIASSMLVAACGHTITLMPRNPELAIGKGSAPSSMGDSGKLSVSLNGKEYDGRWVFVRDGGTVGAAFGSAWGGGTQTYANSTFFGASTAGNGQALMSAEDGSRLRCVFRYNEWGGTGIGECLDDDGEMYDMMIE